MLKRWTGTLAFGALLSLSLTGCSLVEGLLGGGGEEAAAEGHSQLKAGDLPGASSTWEAAVADNATNVDVASGAAYAALLQGDYAAADAALAAAEGDAGERVAEIKMRRALVALKAGDLDAVRTHATASGMPEGQLLAAEVALADGEREEAASLLKQAKGAGGSTGQVAADYLALIDDPEPLVAGLSEAQALWALGERKVAVRSVEELVKNLPDDRDDRDEQILVWAGRAASVSETDVARGLLESLIFPPEGQAWRKVATQAIILCADGEADACLNKFKALDGSAPADGLADARATAAFLIARQDPEVAKKLAGPFISDAAARALLEAGDTSAALESAPGGVFTEYLKAGG